MSGFLIKAAGKTLRHQVDFASIANADEQVIGDAGWLIKAGGAGEVALRIASQSIAGPIAEAEFVGGRPGQTYLITAQADTDAGRTLKHAFVLSVAGHADRAATPFQE